MPDGLRAFLLAQAGSSLDASGLFRLGPFARSWLSIHRFVHAWSSAQSSRAKLQCFTCTQFRRFLTVVQKQKRKMVFVFVFFAIYDPYDELKRKRKRN